jgi:hypothetical protein
VFILPHNGRDPLPDQTDEAGELLMQEVHRRRQARTEERDERLRGWIAAGLVSDDLARDIRWRLIPLRPGTLFVVVRPL